MILKDFEFIKNNWEFKDLCWRGDNPIVRVYWTKFNPQQEHWPGFKFYAVHCENFADLESEQVDVELRCMGSAHWDGLNIIEFGEIDKDHPITKNLENGLLSLEGYINRVHIHELLQIFMFLRELEEELCEPYSPDYKMHYYDINDWHDTAIFKPDKFWNKKN